MDKVSNTELQEKLDKIMKPYALLAERACKKHENVHPYNKNCYIWQYDKIVLSLIDLIQESNKEAKRAGVRLAIRTHHKQYPNCPEKLEGRINGNHH